MTYFLAQVAVLLLAAYLLGAAIGCLTRRLFGYFFSSSDGHLKTGGASKAGAQPVIETSPSASASSGDQSRFERALSHGPSSRQSTASKTAATGATSDTTTHAVKLDTPTLTPVEKPVATSPTPEKADTTSSTKTGKTATTVTPVTIQTRDTTDKPKDAPTPATTTPTPAVVPVSSTDETPDEGEKFTSVSIAAAAAAAAIAARASMGQTATSGETKGSTPASEKPDFAKPAGKPASAAVIPIVAAPATRTEPDDLTRIQKIDDALQRELNSAGVTSYGQIASWQAGDVAKYDALIGSSGRVTRENWIEQAQILSKGGTTVFARDKDAGQTSDASTSDSSSTPMVITPVILTADEPARAETAPGTSARTTPADAGVMAATAAAAASAVAFAATSAISRTTSERDDRKRPVKQAQSKGSGSSQADNTPLPTTTAQADAIPVVPLKPVAVPPEAEPEPEQPDETTPNVVEEASSSTNNLSGFRSVRSAALRGGGGPQPGARFDDLKRIRGIGVLIEKKLNSVGVTSYDEIANWINQDMDHISGLLELKGRIERENWVEQARILASGGHTEFSRRMERGQ